MRLKAVYGLLILFVGCAQVPRPSTYPYTFQQQMQAAHHWHVLASDVAGEVAATLQGGSALSTEAIYVQCGGSAQCISDDRAPVTITPFNQAFHSFLITELKNHSIRVSPDPNNPLKLDWDVQPVVHNANRSKPPFPFQNTVLAGLGFGLAGAWDKLSPAQAGAVTAFGVMPIIDVLQGTNTGPLPHSEVIITTRITEKNPMSLYSTIPGTEKPPDSLLSHKSYVFYINDADWQHYWSRADTSTKSYAVVGR